MPEKRSAGRGRRAPATSRPEEPPPAEGACPLCHGVGWLRADVPYGHPFFGRLISCDCQDQVLRERDIEELQRFSNLDPFRDKTFDNFDRKLPGVDRAYTEARKYAADPKGWLVLMGGYGSGKTHLAAAVANEAVSKHCPCLFTVVPDLLDHLRSTFAPTSPIQYDELFEKVRTTFLLVLDDLGTENATPWAGEKLYQIFNYRYNYALPTVITTNRDLKAIDGRIRSRIQDQALCQIIEIKAGDYRTKQDGERRFRPRRT